MALRLKNSSGNYIELDAPTSIASDVSLTLPNTDGNSGQYLQTDGAGALSWATGLAQGSVITAGTAVASTSGTSISFTSIPSWVKRITVILNGVSTNGSSNGLIQIGSGSFTTSGYLGAANSQGTYVNYTAGFGIRLFDTSSCTVHGYLVLTNVTGNTWVASGSMARSESSAMGNTAGSVALSGTLDRVRVTTVNGTDTFDAGNINIFYEG